MWLYVLVSQFIFLQKQQVGYTQILFEIKIQ